MVELIFEHDVQFYYKMKWYSGTIRPKEKTEQWHMLKQLWKLVGNSDLVLDKKLRRSVTPQHSVKVWTSWHSWSFSGPIAILSAPYCKCILCCTLHLRNETMRGKRQSIYWSSGIQVRCSSILSYSFIFTILHKSLPFHISVCPSLLKDRCVCLYCKDVLCIHLYV